MPCLRPFFRKFDTSSLGYSDNYALPLPCGNCEYCRYKSSRLWSFRLGVEANEWQYVYFLTLTYRNEDLPHDFSLSVPHCQNFIKLLRYFSRAKLKYFLCGEYGPKTSRPHYHAIIFSDSPLTSELVEKSWKKGFIDFQEPRNKEEVIKYVSRYVTKKIGKKSASYARLGGRKIEFNIQSKGLGSSLVDKIPHFTRYVIQNGKKEFLGRYLIDKLKKKFSVFEEQIKESLIILSDLWYPVFSSFTGYSPYKSGSYERQAYTAYNTQFERDFLARCKIFKRNENEKI